MEPENDSANPGPSVHEYWRILVHRRALILQTFLVIAVAGTIVTFLTRPVYQGTAQLLVESPAMSVSTVDSSNPLSQILALSQAQTVATQVEVLQSQPLIDKVEQAMGPVDLTVSELKDTNVIQVVGEASSPRAAADAPNTLLADYIEQDVDQNLTEIRSAKQFALTQEAAARQRLQKSGEDLVKFKQNNRLTDVTADQAALIGRIGDLVQQVQKDEQDLRALQAQLAAEKYLLAGQPSYIVQNTQSTNTARSDLRNQIEQLKVDRVSMTQKGGFTGRAPQVIAVDARIAAMEKQMQQTPLMVTTQSSSPNPAVADMKSKVAEMTAEEAALTSHLATSRQALEGSKSQVGHFAGWQLAYSSLMRENDAAEAAEKMFSDKLADLTLREQAHHSMAHIIAPAQVPETPVRPKRLQSIVFACLLGLFLGVCLALVQEFLDDRINSIDESTRLLALPALGYIPQLAEGSARLLPDMRGIDPAAESYRALRTNVHFAAVDAPVRTMLVTSPNPGEGKTTTSCNLAFAMALDGRRVILVDADLRRPSVHKALSLQSVPGLTDVLLGHASLDDALQDNATLPNLQVLTSGSLPPNPSELINSRKFRNLVLELADRADVVIFDSPPVLVASDAAILGSQMDGTVLVVEAGGTKKTPAKRAVQILQQARANILGINYNKINMQASGSNYYYSYHADYHALPDGPPPVPDNSGFLEDGGNRSGRVIAPPKKGEDR